MKISVLGTGYVGLVTGASFASLGHDVICVDIDQNKINKINDGKSPFFEPKLDDLLLTVVKNKKLKATNNLNDALEHSELTFIAVGTPSTPAGIDLAQIKSAAKMVGTYLKTSNRYHVVVVKSTVVPGTTESIIKEELETSSGKKIGAFGLCMNPEFLREGCAVDDFLNPDRIVIGSLDEKSKSIMNQLYSGFSCPVVNTNPTNAEFIKYSTNTLLATLISFSNEIATLCENIPGADADTVMKGLYLDQRLTTIDSNKIRKNPSIVSYLYPGPGYGGSCFPKDLFALRLHAKNLNINTPLLDSVHEVNETRPKKAVQLLEKKLGNLTGKTIAVLGLAFKQDTDDVRMSPSIAIIKLLLDRGANVKAYDPLVHSLSPETFAKNIQYTNEISECLKGANAACIITPWKEFKDADWNFLISNMSQPILFDMRNILIQNNLSKNIDLIRIGKI